jgi:hypothetical protein
MAITNRSYTAGHFHLEIDGMPSSAYVKSFEGGWAKRNAVDEQVGANNLRIKHVTTAEIDPITLEVGMAQSDFLLQWIANSWKRSFARHDGQVVHADFNYRAQFTHEFKGALIEETAFPTLDAASKDLLYLKVKLRAETANYVLQSGEKITGTQKGLAKLWSANAFRLRVDGLDTSKVSKIDGFSVKQGIKQVSAGIDTMPQLEPTKIDFPDLKVHMSLHHAGPVLDWYKTVVVKGIADPDGTRNGAIEFLAPNRSDVLFAVDLYDVGIKAFSIPKTEANSGQVQRCSFDLFVGRMELSTTDRRGLE